MSNISFPYICNEYVMKRIILEKLKIISFERLGRDDDLWLEDNTSKSAPDERKSEINNVPTSGIVITGINTFKSVIVKDPRGFSCTVSNLDELLTEITIEKGVIQEDLVYGRPNDRSNSWILLTPKMIDEIGKELKSVKDLRPGEVYMLYEFQTVVYLGRLPWRSDYDGIFRERHIFAYPEERYIAAVSIQDASFLKDTGVDDPDLYSEALGTLKSSHKGNKDIAVIGLRVRSDLPQIDFSKIIPTLFSSGIDMDSYGQRVTGKVALINRVKSDVVEVICLIGLVSRGTKSRSPYSMTMDNELLPAHFMVAVTLHIVEIKNGCLTKGKYITSGEVDCGYDLSKVDLINSLSTKLNRTIDGNRMECVDLENVQDRGWYAYCDCILSNGNIVSGESLLTQYLNF